MTAGPDRRRREQREGHKRDKEEESGAEKQIFHGWLERNKAVLCLGGTVLLKAGSVIKGMPSKKKRKAKLFVL